MSERGSFVTEYIYCGSCFTNAKKILSGDSKSFRSVCIPGFSGMSEVMPIIAGKVGGSYINSELHYFELEIIPVLEAALCHEMKIAVIPDSGAAKIFTAFPRGVKHECADSI